jgi:hypothetical protein
MLFDFIDLPRPLEKQAKDFLDKASQKTQSSQDSIIILLDFHKQRVRRKDLAANRTLKNYHRAAKLFYEMINLTTLNWKTISKGLPRVKNSSAMAEVGMRACYCSNSEQFREWCADYLEHIWHHSRPFDTKKLVEV